MKNKLYDIKCVGYPNVRNKSEQFGLTFKSVWIVPENFEQLKNVNPNVLHSTDYDTIVKILRSENIPYSIFDAKNKIHNRSFEIFSFPIMIFMYELINNNPEIIHTALTKIIDLVKKHAKPFVHNVSESTVSIKIVKEVKPGKFYKYIYKGPESSLSEFLEYMKGEKNEL